MEEAGQGESGLGVNGMQMGCDNNDLYILQQIIA